MSKKQQLRTYGSPIHGKAEEDKTRCVESVFGNYRSHQCTRKRGHGPDGLYCAQHAAKIERRKLCYHCNGSGKCNDCDGNGNYTCPHCGTEDMSCQLCEQTGVCWVCKGTGRAKEGK